MERFSSPDFFSLSRLSRKYLNRVSKKWESIRQRMIDQLSKYLDRRDWEFRIVSLERIIPSSFLRVDSSEFLPGDGFTFLWENKNEGQTPSIWNIFFFESRNANDSLFSFDNAFWIWSFIFCCLKKWTCLSSQSRVYFESLRKIKRTKTISVEREMSAGSSCHFLSNFFCLSRFPTRLFFQVRARQKTTKFDGRVELKSRSSSTRFEIMSFVIHEKSKA